MFAKGIRYKAEKEQHAEGYERYRYLIHLYPLPHAGVMVRNAKRAPQGLYGRILTEADELGHCDFSSAQNVITLGMDCKYNCLGGTIPRNIPSRGRCARCQAKHRSMGTIAALTNALTLVISQSTEDVRIFSGGKIFMEVEKSPGKGGT